ncbi:MAG: hypothetical protein CXT78_01640 [Thaumarchaeota archaeon]|nr:MAG: hypothetical protein CXT78_01640 [Nitrososphaerota archaeon]
MNHKLNSSTDEIITLSATKKLGKIVKIKISYNQESQLIQTIKITGDFFIHPEEVIEQLEQRLCGIKLIKKKLENEMKLVLKDSKIFGFDIDSLVEMILKACENKK